MTAIFDTVPEPHRAAVHDALTAATDDIVSELVAVAGGASGALTYRATAGAHDFLVRVETARDYFRNPERTYASMLAAAEAGVAPAVHVTDTGRGVAVIDFVSTVPLETHPGGGAGLLAALGDLVRRLQTTPPFEPALADFGQLIDRMLDVVIDGGVFRAGALDRHREILARVRDQYPFGSLPQVSAHNDVNPFNVLYDGERLWLVDWELSFRNDPFADLAIVANNHAPTDDLVDVLLRSALGHHPTDDDRARLTVMRQLSRLFYGCIIASGMVGHRAGEATDALTPEEFLAAFSAGEIVPGTEHAMFELAKMNFGAFLTGCDTPMFDAELTRCASLA